MPRLDARKAALPADLEAVSRLTACGRGAGGSVSRVEARINDYRGLLARQTTEGCAIRRELLAESRVPSSDEGRRALV